MPVQREIDFKIDLIHSAQPIFEATYRMTPTELREQKTHLDELKKGFIHPSVS